MQVQMFRPGLWRWTTAHPDWTPESTNWGPEVGSVYLETAGAIVLVDPLVPADENEAERFWTALDRDVERIGLPVVAVTTISIHERNTAEVVARYAGSRWRPGDRAPSGVETIPIACGRETLVLATDHRALITADLLIGDDAGGIRLCPASWLGEGMTLDQARRELAVLLDLDIEIVLPSHGAPVPSGGSAAIRAALT